jgi:tryptophan-rich sensory protein
MVFLGVSILWIAVQKKEYRILTLFTPYVLWISFASYLNYESISK